VSRLIVGLFSAVLIPACCVHAQEGGVRSRAISCDFTDVRASRFAFGPCVIEESDGGGRYQWRLRFDDGTAITVIEETNEKRAARSWSIEGQKAVGIEINRMHFTGATLDRNVSVGWEYGSANSQVSKPSISGDVQYDVKAARQAQQFNEVVTETKACLHEALLGPLQNGRRQRDELVSWATRNCSAKFYYIYDSLGRSREEGRAFLIGLADAELKDILASSR
jgi:hypothetical protein